MLIAFSLCAINPVLANNKTDDFEITLIGQTKEAIDNGVELTFICEFALVKHFLFLSWTDRLKRHRFTLNYHTLSNRYIVRVDAKQTPHIFRSITQATGFMTQQSMELFTAYADRQNPYSMRLSLSKFELPGPMRLNAFISDDWDLDTGWIEWTFES